MNKNKEELLSINLVLTKQNDTNCLELRKIVSNKENMKTIIRCAMKDTPIVVYPVFYNKIRAINTLLDHGIIEKDDKGEYIFLI